MTKPREPRTIVVAGSYQEVRLWCRDNDVNPNSNHVISLCRPGDSDRLRGIRLEPEDRVVYTGSWANATVDIWYEFRRVIYPLEAERRSRHPGS